MKETARRLSELLETHGFYYYDVDDILEASKYNNCLELVKKAYGNSIEQFVEDVFKDDYKELVCLTRKLNIKLPTYVYFD